MEKNKFRLRIALGVSSIYLIFLFLINYVKFDLLNVVGICVPMGVFLLYSQKAINNSKWIYNMILMLVGISSYAYLSATYGDVIPCRICMYFLVAILIYSLLFNLNANIIIVEIIYVLYLLFNFNHSQDSFLLIVVMVSICVDCFKNDNGWREYLLSKIKKKSF